MNQILAVGLGGFLGCLARFGIGKLTSPMGLAFPLSTLISNVIAGYIIGFVTQLDTQSNIFPPHIKLFLTTGMMGGLSTFSTFSLETVNLFSQSKYFLAIGNILLNVALSLGGVLLGMLTARCFAKKG